MLLTLFKVLTFKNVSLLETCSSDRCDDNSGGVRRQNPVVGEGVYGPIEALGSCPVITSLQSNTLILIWPQSSTQVWDLKLSYTSLFSVRSAAVMAVCVMYASCCVGDESSVLWVERVCGYKKTNASVPAY